MSLPGMGLPVPVIIVIDAVFRAAQFVIEKANPKRTPSPSARSSQDQKTNAADNNASKPGSPAP